MKTVTMRELLASKRDAKVLKKLLQLNVGVSYKTNGILGSKWTIGCCEPTLEWVQWVRLHVADIDQEAKTFGLINWLDTKLSLKLDWTRHFANCPTGPML